MSKPRPTEPTTNSSNGTVRGRNKRSSRKQVGSILDSLKVKISNIEGDGSEGDVQELYDACKSQRKGIQKAINDIKTWNYNDIPQEPDDVQEITDLFTNIEKTLSEQDDQTVQQRAEKVKELGEKVVEFVRRKQPPTKRRHFSKRTSRKGSTTRKSTKKNERTPPKAPTGTG